jgi:hypothetical protein
MFLALASALPAAALAQGVAQPAARDFSQSPVTPGSWTYRPLPGASQAYFTDSGGTIRLFVSCAIPARTVTISRTSAAPAASLTVWTSTMERALPARFEPNAMRVSASFTAASPLLDAIAFSRGRIAIWMPGFAPLIVAPGPEAARAFEDCRN